MKTYFELINQSYNFPTKEFQVENNQLYFHDISLMELISKYSAPLKVTYLPKISQNIQLAKQWFKKAMKKVGYPGKYTYCYCTKASHFYFNLEEILKNDVELEISSSYDIGIIRFLYDKGLITKQKYILCNGFKNDRYLEKIVSLINNGFENCIPILDHKEEISYYKKHIKQPYNIGIRLAADEEPNFSFYTSRLGMRYSDILNFYKQEVEGDPQITLKMLHFFVHKGITNTAYYWSELSRFVHQYCELKKICSDLTEMNIGGGLPIKNSLDFDFDYAYMIENIVQNIQWICKKKQVAPPNIYTEFGNYTVGESGAVIYNVLGEKWQNDVEAWYMVNGSFITQIPDTWGINQKFILLPINGWDIPYHKVAIGGITCDSEDYYDAEANSSEVFLPRVEKKKKLYIGFFHTGAYQESIGGYGGIQHCLIPAPKHVIIQKNEAGKLVSRLFAEEQQEEHMLSLAGYKHI